MAAQYLPRLLRCYSTPKKARKLWVKLNGNQPTQVDTKDCKHVDDFADKVKQKLSTNCQVALFTDLEQKPLRAGLKIADLLKTDFASNSDENPLFVKLSPLVQESVVTKTIYVRDTDEDGEFTDNYVKYKVKSNENLRDTYKDGKGLIRLAEPTDVIVDFDELKDGERYQVHKFSQNYGRKRKQMLWRPRPCLR
jgi:hypothetical protein